ncbi:MAG: Mycothiol acetyltransferase [Phycisphaerae bacterium]|nr:Mycothiol acetyltransferase [Phycisphaerae bacterium]
MQSVSIGECSRARLLLIEVQPWATALHVSGTLRHYDLAMIEYRAVDPQTIVPAVRTVLADGAPQVIDETAARGYLLQLECAGAKWRGTSGRRDGATVGVAISLLPPGRIAMLLLPPGPLSNGTLDDQREVLLHELSELHGLRLHYVQLLIDPACAYRRLLAECCGFWRLAGLQYMERDPRFPWHDAPESEVEWLGYEAGTHAAFAQCIEATYRESLDCPRLTGLRGVEDVIAGHKCGPAFVPHLWQLARVDGLPAGCLLMTVQTEECVELSYMGVTPEFRGRGLGAVLLRRGLELAREGGFRRIALAVDAGNARALGLYRRFAFRDVSAREAYLHTW